MSSPPSTFTSSDLAELKERRPLADLLRARGVELKPAGSVLKATCPFHEDSTPSFTVYPDNHYHCFGCDKHGDVIQFLMDLDGISFREACEKLGGKSTGASNWPRYSGKKPHSQRRQKEENLRQKAEAASRKILSDFAWSFDEIWEDSPIRIDSGIDGFDPRGFIGTVFHGDEVIWIGEIHDSNRPGSDKHFRTINEWLTMDRLPGSRICPAIFRPGETCRRNDRVLSVPCIVLEADNAIGRNPETDAEKALNRAANAALIRWCRDGLGMRLVAIVDTGNKSLHAWFVRPSKQCLDELKVIASTLGIDDLIGKPAQPVRLPGFPHEKTGRNSQLLWLNEGRSG